MEKVKTITVQGRFGPQERLIFPNDVKVAEHKLTHNRVTIFTGTRGECFLKLQQSQSNSADWAMRYEGWKVEPTGNEIPDPDIEVEVVKTFLNVLKFKYRGETYEVTKNAIYGNIGSLKPGDKVRIDSNYATLPS